MAGPRQRMLVASITDPESEHFAGATRREQVQALDNVAMLELHEWLNHMRFRLFGDLRPWDQQDAVHETFIRTLDFAHKMRKPSALHGACFTIGLRVRAQRVTEYIRERCSPPGVVPLVPWHPERRLFERDGRTGALLAIRSLQASDQEILLRFYFKEQTPEQIQFEMQLTATQFRLRKNRAISRVRLRASAVLANVRISRAAERVSATLNAPQPSAPAKEGNTSWSNNGTRPTQQSIQARKHEMHPRRSTATDKERQSKLPHSPTNSGWIEEDRTDHLKRTGCVQNENCKPESEVPDRTRATALVWTTGGGTSMIENSLERGGPIGSPEEDWFRAEQDLKNEQTGTA